MGVGDRGGDDRRSGGEKDGLGWGAGEFDGVARVAGPAAEFAFEGRSAGVAEGSVGGVEQFAPGAARGGESVAFGAELGEEVEQTRVARRGREVVGRHAGAFEERTGAAHGGERFGAGRERVVEIGADERGGETARAEAGVDDDAGDAAEVSVESLGAGGGVGARESVAPGEGAPGGVERGHGDDEGGGEGAAAVGRAGEPARRLVVDARGEDFDDGGGMARSVVERGEGAVGVAVVGSDGERIADGVVSDGWGDAARACFGSGGVGGARRFFGFEAAGGVEPEGVCGVEERSDGFVGGDDDGGGAGGESEVEGGESFGEGGGDGAGGVPIEVGGELVEEEERADRWRGACERV